MMSLECKPHVLTGKQLIGRTGRIYLTEGYDSIEEMHKYIITVDNNMGTTECPAKSHKQYIIGDTVVISNFVNAYYII